MPDCLTPVCRGWVRPLASGRLSLPCGVRADRLGGWTIAGHTYRWLPGKQPPTEIALERCNEGTHRRIGSVVRCVLHDRDLLRGQLQ